MGSLTLDQPVLLAPMAGYTDSAFRSICMRLGAAMCFTEVTNAEGLARDSKPTFHLLETSPEEHPISGHIYGVKPDVMAQAAAIIEKLGKFSSIDINCGCPVRKIVAKGAGAALMKSPKKIEEIVRAVRAATSLPVTVKTRIGFHVDKTHMLDIAKAAEAGGASAICVHARFAANHHSGPADWEALAVLKQNLRIPLIGNGGINKPDDALAMIRQTGVDGVMIGRAAVGNPWVFAEILSLLAGRGYQPPTMEERKAVILEHLDRQIALKIKERLHRRRATLPPDQSAVLHFRGHLFRYLHAFPGFAGIKRTFQTLKTVDAVKAAIDYVQVPTHRYRPKPPPSQQALENADRDPRG
ncbi:MAG: tRNA dihydrouridine synthase DusB [Verrucomicrobia bacterium]|nr:tRNA dihydrouridine synthase DusB [Verrucomicrobiota bacterium]